jgi:CRP-like cAMP-binding protein
MNFAMTDPVLLQTLSRLQPLASLGEQSLRGLISLCRHERVTRSLDATQMRDWAGQVVYLHRGEIKLDYADGAFRVFVGGIEEALFPLARGGDAPVSTKAITDIELLRFDEEAIDIVATWDQLAGAAAQMMDCRALSGRLATQSLAGGVFSALPPAHFDALLARFQPVRVQRGEVVVRQGDSGDYYYVVESGRARVTREIAGAVTELAELLPGDAFGEEALVQDTARNATVTMNTDGVLLRLGKEDFTSLLKEPLLQRLSAAEAERRIVAGATWIDVRFGAEYRHDGLPGALNIPLNELRQAMPLLDADREYIVYCRSGRRSSAAAFLMSQRGLRASLLDGGMGTVSDKKERVEK